MCIQATYVLRKPAAHLCSSDFFILRLQMAWWFLYFPTDYFCQEDLLGQSNKELIPSNWLWFLSFLLESIITEPPYFLFKFDMEAEGDAYFHSQLVVFVLWRVSIILYCWMVCHLPCYLGNPSSGYRHQSYIVGWFVKGWFFFILYLQWFRRALRSWSIDFIYNFLFGLSFFYQHLTP